MSHTNNFRRGLLATGVALTLLLSACATSTRLEPAAPVEDRSAGARSATTIPPSDGASSTGQTSQSSVATLDLGKNGDAGGAGNVGLPRTVYFDFDSFVVKDAYRPVIETNAKYLSTNRKRGLMIEGHTDERGGREYNLALGQKRAEAVVRALGLLGVTDSQTEAVSYGEERPAVMGNDEAAWAKNRRAELRDR